MHKLVVLYPKPADPDHFREYYVTNHLPLVTRMPGLLAWRYSFDVAASMPRPPALAAELPVKMKGSSGCASCHAGTAVCEISAAVYEATAYTNMNRKVA